MKVQRLLIKISGAAVLFALLLGAYWFAIRPGQLHWGSTPEEAAGAMPGDEVVPNATFKATRAITIAGTPEEIWPWLVQMGHGRAGFYGYDLLENQGSPRGLRSAEQIIPELQQIAEGDLFPIFPGSNLLVKTMDHSRVFLWVGTRDYPDMEMSWILVPLETSPGSTAARTRLISRVQFRHHWNNPSLIGPILFTEFLDHLAVRRILLGVKGRVEGNIEPFSIQLGEVITLVIGLLEFIAAVLLFLTSKQWLKSWAFALATGAAFAFIVYAHAPYWINAALEVLVLIGLLAFSTGAHLNGKRGMVQRLFIPLSCLVFIIAGCAQAAEPAPIPTPGSQRIGEFRRQQDGEYGYAMLRPASWLEADNGAGRTYYPDPQDDRMRLSLSAVNLTIFHPRDGSKPDDIRLILFQENPTLEGWTGALVQTLHKQDFVHLERNLDNARIYSVRSAEFGEHIQLIAYAIDHSAPFEIILNVGGEQALMEEIIQAGLMDDFVTMVESVRAEPR